MTKYMLRHVLHGLLEDINFTRNFEIKFNENWPMPRYQGPNKQSPIDDDTKNNHNAEC